MDKKNKVAKWSPYLINYALAHVCTRPLMRSEHVCGIKQIVQLLFAQKTMFEHEVIDALSALKGLLGNLCRGFVTDDGVESRDNADGVLYSLKVMFAVDGDAADTFLAQDLHHIL